MDSLSGTLWEYNMMYPDSQYKLMHAHESVCAQALFQAWGQAYCSIYNENHCLSDCTPWYMAARV